MKTRELNGKIVSYDSAHRWHQENCRTPKGDVKLCHNTRLRPLWYGEYAVPECYQVVLHRTAVVTFYRDGVIVLNSGGYRTATTKARINACLPEGYYLVQRGGYWRLYWPSGSSEPFEDGMIHPPELDTGA